MVADAFEELRGAFRDAIQAERSAPVFDPAGARHLSVDEMNPMGYAGQTVSDPWQTSIWDGGKFWGGFGATTVWGVDYWTLRQRSSQLFTSNLYARGIIRRLITNEIGKGLAPEACPDEDIIGVPEDSLQDWTERTENRFAVWAAQSEHCDYYGERTFGALQREARREALVCGDVLVVVRRSRTTGLPRVQLIPGDRVRSPLSSNTTVRRGHTVLHGVERDARGRVVAYWIVQDTGLESKRLPVRGEKSGRRIAWLLFGTDKRYDDVRGQPLLSIVLQSLQEIDRYRDSTQRKALVNSFVAGFIKKSEDKIGSLPVTGVAVRKDAVSVSDSDGATRELKINSQLPGAYFEELQHGEEPIPLSSKGTDLAFGEFERAVVSAVAWANEIPPEILWLAFTNNYSASQAALNEFKAYLDLRWASWGETFCSPFYVDWLLSETLLGKNPERGILDAWRDPMQYDVFGAWIAADWYGSIKPTTDVLKQVRGSQLLIAEGLSTNAREARVTTGTKFSKNIKRLKRENELKAEAARPLAEFRKEYGIDVSDIDSSSPGASASADLLLTATGD